MVTATVAAVADERGDCGGIGRGRGRLWRTRKREAAAVEGGCGRGRGSCTRRWRRRTRMRAVAVVEGGDSDDDGGHGQGQQRLCFCCSCCYHWFLSLGSSPTLQLQLFKDGVLQTKIRDKDDPRLSKMRKEVVAGGKDAMEVDNDFFLVPVKISDHQLQTSSQNKKKDKAAVFRSCPFHFYNAKNTAEICRAHDEHQCKKFNSYGK
uniref:Uncharacterized protein n=1 Tax=Oryza glaberrima TaxID=4538 RepID=I1QGJ4_ORYGL